MSLHPPLVASTIQQQLGGPHFIAMTGASHFNYLVDRLTFKIPRKNGINFVAIILGPDDLYSMKFLNINTRKKEIQEKFEISGMLAEHLQPYFTKYTGLETTLGAAAPASDLPPMQLYHKVDLSGYDYQETDGSNR